MIRQPGLLLVLVLATFQGLTLYIFSKGFLTARIELPNVSSCSDFADEQQPGTNSSCWAPPKYSKLVLIVIDALRTDFVFGTGARDLRRFNRTVQLLQDAV